ncbi:hypothetical protein C8J56DRAFT_1041777 [Mycena floridula]|nr:hypothetical protein C8J56DRAFT_1041777 [Mycena floridula]
MQFSALSSIVLAALTFVSVSANPASAPVANLMTEAQMIDWLSKFDPADITYVGGPINPLSSRSSLSTTVSYCAHWIGSVCGAPCTVYTGGTACLHAPGTNCLAATHNVGFCNEDNCGGTCNQLSECGDHLDNHFCATPGTNSILVGTL